jgi:flagellar basal-body rod protein FlgG
MIAGLYAASTNMDAVIRQQDAIAGNLSNAGVSGHKGEEMVFRSFPELLFTKSSASTHSGSVSNRTIGKVGTGVGVDWSYRNFEAGPLAETGVPTDLTVDGEGFFVVKTPRGERYTRNSQFKLLIDKGGKQATFTTQEGYPLLGDKGPVQVPVDQKFDVDITGNVLVGGQPVNRLRLIEVPERNVMLPETGALFQVEDRWKSDVKPAKQSLVRQGVVEKSNVNTVVEMARMIESFRNYEAAAKVVTVLDRTLEQAANEVGRSV